MKQNKGAKENEFKENYTFAALEDLNDADLNDLLNMPTNSVPKKGNRKKMLVGPEDRESAAIGQDALIKLTNDSKKKIYKDPYKNLDNNRNVLNISHVNPKYNKDAATMDGPSLGQPQARSLQTLEPSSIGLDKVSPYRGKKSKIGNTRNLDLDSRSPMASGSHSAASQS